MSRAKKVFEKGYTPNWSTEIFTITKVASTNPVTYHFKDYREQPISGGFYEEELQKVKYDDVYLVEKIVKKRGNEVYVKWLVSSLTVDIFKSLLINSFGINHGAFTIFLSVFD